MESSQVGNERDSVGVHSWEASDVHDRQQPHAAADTESGDSKSADERDVADLEEACATERESMTPRQTADCAGADLARLYDNEEDGGS